MRRSGSRYRSAAVVATTRQTDWAQVVQTQTFHSLGDFNLSIGQAITSDSLVIAEKMVADKTEEQLREETRARRARQELKNMPLPLNRFFFPQLLL